jgi:hypothetical protein
LIPWLIIRTDIAKELYVARQIALAGFDAWVPIQCVLSRPSVARRVSAHSNARKVKELPVLPKRLFAAVPVALQRELTGIRHLDSIERDAASMALQIPHGQILTFKAEIDRMNADILALNAIATRKSKAKWKNLKDALQELVSQAKTELEIAA